MGKRRATRRQIRYLRYLEKACDTEPTLRPTATEASFKISYLETVYKVIFDRQPMMRGN
jgi:hypothetical protein